MDAYTARKCHDRLVSLYPGERIRVVWDYAGAHIDTGVQEYAKALGIVLEFINKGMPSLHQPCDLWANQPLKLRASITTSAFHSIMQTSER